MDRFWLPRPARTQPGSGVQVTPTTLGVGLRVVPAFADRRRRLICSARGYRSLALKLRRVNGGPCALGTMAPPHAGSGEAQARIGESSAKSADIEVEDALEPPTRDLALEGDQPPALEASPQGQVPKVASVTLWEAARPGRKDADGIAPQPSRRFAWVESLQTMRDDQRQPARQIRDLRPGEFPPENRSRGSRHQMDVHRLCDSTQPAPDSWLDQHIVTSGTSRGTAARWCRSEACSLPAGIRAPPRRTRRIRRSCRPA